MAWSTAGISLSTCLAVNSQKISYSLVNSQYINYGFFNSLNIILSQCIYKRLFFTGGWMVGSTDSLVLDPSPLSVWTSVPWTTHMRKAKFSLCRWFNPVTLVILLSDWLCLKWVRQTNEKNQSMLPMFICHHIYKCVQNCSEHTDKSTCFLLYIRGHLVKWTHTSSLWCP